MALRTDAPLLAALLLVALCLPAEAKCYADYKAKRDDPLRLQYGVIELPDAACGNRRRAAAEIQARIGRGGWSLLDVVSIFGPEGLDRRRPDAGENFLRY
jgi:hypothetical protein